MHSSEISNRKSVLTVALAGNPNSGKTTLFNALTGLNQKVGNYPGVTVEKKTGRLVVDSSHKIDIIDLPGTYSLSVRSPDEQVARDVLLGHALGTPRPDVVVCIVDAGNLERNLYLVSQIQDLKVSVIVALNMMDEAQRHGKTIDISKLSFALGVPIVPMIATTREGVDQLKVLLVKNVEVKYNRQWGMPPAVEEEVERIVQLLMNHCKVPREEAFFQALMLLARPAIAHEEHPQGGKIVYSPELIRELDQWQKDILARVGVRARSAAIEARYAWIKSIVRDCVNDKFPGKASRTHAIDAVLTHKFFGWVMFLLMMSVMFYTIFSIATYPMNMIDQAFGALSDWVRTVMPAGDLRDLMTDGIIAGVGGVVIFLPQILILFFFIGLLNDTGYMARAAFMMDRVMSKVGLHGKSFIPLLSSFACAIPGIMAARTIENPKDRLVTILVAPLMSCSARLPVYTLMIAVMIPSAGALQKTGIMLSMYLLGIVGACAMAWIFKKTLLKGPKPLFIMELPPYRFPSLSTIIRQMWERSQLFLKRAGTVIMALSIILWALMSFPKVEAVDASDALRHSYAGQMGQMLEPLLKPLGFDWRIGIGLIGSFAAREVFVSTMSIVFNVGEETEEGTLREAFQNASWPDGRPLFTPLVCVGLMIFFVFAMQCLSTVAIVWRETRGIKWVLFQLVYMTLLAYLAALLVYQAGRWLGL